MGGNGMTNEPIPFLDLKAQFKTVGCDVKAAIDRVISSQSFILGPEVEALEKDIAAYSETQFAVGVSSGSDALLVALMALELMPGDEVITTPYSFFASAGCIARLGATPVFVDIDPDTYNIACNRIEAAITPRTRAILPVHLYGQCCDMDELSAVAAAHDLAVIEDAAQAIGAEYKGRRAGSLGTIGCISFFPTKNLGAFGDGGMVVTSDARLADKLRILRAHGAKPKYHHQIIGGNFRLDAIQAAIVRAKFSSLDQWTARRQEIARTYEEEFSALRLPDGLLRTPVVHHSRHVFNQYVVRTPMRDGLMNHLRDSGIGCNVYYPEPLHVQACFAGLGYRAGSFPNAEAAALETLALPVYPELTTNQIHRVVTCCGEFLRQPHC
jgi:dTDP-4-amino-4,6-dideoxygalactose transaminase